MTWEEKLIFLEKINGVRNPYLKSLRSNHEIHYHLEEYVSHSTRAYRMKDSIYVATEVTFSRSSAVKTSREIPSDLESVLEEEILNEYGIISKSRESSMLVCYMIYDSKSLYFRTQQGASQSDRLSGDPLLLLEGKLFKFKEISFPMTRALYGMSGDVGSGQKCPCPIELRATFIQPEWFIQGKSSRIVVPGMVIPDFLHLNISTSGFKRDEGALSKIVVTKVRVELHELVSRSAGGGKAPHPEPLQRYYRKNKLLKRRCRKSLSQLKLSTFEDENVMLLPPSLYHCILPEVGPTCYDDRTSRAYAIKVIVEVKCNEGKDVLTMSTFSEISIARRGYQYVKRHVPPISPYFLNVPTSQHNLTVLEKFPRMAFSPDVCGHTKFEELAHSLDTDYRSHQVDTFVVDGEILSVTVINIELRSGLGKASNFQEVCRERMVSTLGSGPAFKAGECFILCEVTNSSNILGEENTSELSGGLFVEVNGRRVRYTFPYRCPLYLNALGFDHRKYRLPVSLRKKDWKMDLTFACKFKEPCGFKQPRGEKVVLPRMRVGDFLELELSLPEAYGDWAYRDTSFKITRLSVSIVERLCSNKRHNNEIREIEELLCDTELEETFCWSNFEGVARPGAWGQMKRKIPREYYDCALPELGPTFFASDVYRSYYLLCQLRILVDDERKKTMKVRQKIKIAALGRNCSPFGSMPPQYGAWPPDQPPSYKVPDGVPQVRSCSLQ